MTDKKILISTSSFGKYDETPVKKLKGNGFEVVMNPYGKRLTKKETVELGKDCVGIVAGVEEYDKEVLEQLPKLKVLSRCGTGTDSIDLKECEKKGIIVKRTPEAPARAVAELVIGFMLDLNRRIGKMDRGIRKGEWKKEMGNLIQGKTIGVLGLGHIGKIVCELLKPFGVELIAYDLKPDRKWAEKNNVSIVELNELIEKSDIITIHVPYNEKTKNLINKGIIGNMKKNTILINTSRGGIINENDLYDALKNGKIGGCALDVYEKEPYDGPLKELENIILTPHIGSYAVESRIKMENDAVDNLIENLR